MRVRLLSTRRSAPGRGVVVEAFSGVVSEAVLVEANRDTWEGPRRDGGWRAVEVEEEEEVDEDEEATVGTDERRRGIASLIATSAK